MQAEELEVHFFFRCEIRNIKKERKKDKKKKDNNPNTQNIHDSASNKKHTRRKPGEQVYRGYAYQTRFGHAQLYMGQEA